MAIFRLYDTAYLSYDLNNSAKVTKATRTHIQVSDNAGGAINFFGNFSYNNSGLDSGTIERLNILRNGGKLFEIKGASFDILDIVDAVDSGGVRAGVEYMMSGNDKVYGASLNDKLFGYAGDDIINGRSGADKMKGGIGDDVYIVDNARDSVREQVGQGIDKVKASVNYTLNNYVENLSLKGKSNLKAFGNDADNELTGNRGNNLLKGFDGNDTLNGKSGSDKMKGGAGDDTYFIDDSMDKAIELLNEGTDTVFSKVSFTLGSYVENLTLQGTDNLTGNGNAESNTLVGNVGDNILFGDAGNDIITGGSGDDAITGGLGNDELGGGDGADTFFWNKSDIPGSGFAADSINDFDASEGDVIELADLLSDSSHTLEAFAAPDAVGSGQHLQLSIKDGSSAEVQTINVTNTVVTSDVDATNIMNTLLSSGAIEDGL